MTGYTSSPDFPTTIGAFSMTFNKGIDGGSLIDDAFVAKLSPDGSWFTYATFLGGSDGEYGKGIALDSSGNVYLVGDTYSPDFPTTAGAAFGPGQHGGLQDVFIAKISIPEVDANPGVLQFNTTAYSVREDGGSVLITVTRRGGERGKLTVDFMAFDGTATLSSDYATTSGTLIFGMGKPARPSPFLSWTMKRWRGMRR